jgi:hypothetical protein
MLKHIGAPQPAYFFTNTRKAEVGQSLDSKNFIFKLAQTNENQ